MCAPLLCWGRDVQPGPTSHIVDGLEATADRLQRKGSFARALAVYRQVLAEEPERVTALSNAGILLAKLGDIQQARELLQRAAALNEDPAILYNLAMAERAAGRFTAALRVLDRVLALRPDDTNGLAGKAQTLEMMGDAAAAHELLAEPLAKGPRTVPLVLAYARASTQIGQAAEARHAVQALFATKQLDAHEKRQLSYALGWAEDALGNYKAAFAAFVAANAMSHKYYDPHGVERQTAGVLGRWSRDVFRRLPRVNQRPIQPILIVGMPRSGTSLVEQILDSHSRISGAGELPDLQQIANAFAAPAAALSSDTLDAPAGRYHETLRRHAREGDWYVCDKMPTNFRHLGLAAALAPNARVIHCMRDARDTGLSCFFHNFRRGNAFADDLRHVGHFYQQYQRLMAHWWRVCPLPILDVSYEALVETPEPTIRSVLAFLELPFEAACLAPEENTRVVATASRQQVRQPIYKTAVGRWRHYAPYLQPLEQALSGQPAP